MPYWIQEIELKMLTGIGCRPHLCEGAIETSRKCRRFFFRTLGVIESMIIKILSERPESFNQEGEITIFNRPTPGQSDWSDASKLDEVQYRIRMLDAEGYPPEFVRVGPYKLEFSHASRNVDFVVSDVSIRKVEE